MEIICEKDCRFCTDENCIQRRCPQLPQIRSPKQKILEERIEQNFDWNEGAKANILE